MGKKFLYQDLTKNIINCIYEVYNILGIGFLETVYHKALLEELKIKKLKVNNEKIIEIHYKGNLVGEYKADIIVDDKVIIEIKAVSQLQKHHEAQLLNYLNATGIKVGLLVNFGEKFEIKRRIY
ncbi:MAG: GxxExxY protein [Desulfuromonas sp. SDB]|nr:MAG: GxxExxY protein [Desulfuromonas sp. SDB]